jgi:hypothetical protein
METVIDTKAGAFRVRVLTDVRHEGARTTVIIVNSLTSRMTLNALQSFRKFNDVPTNYVVVDNFSEQWVLDDLVKEAGSYATIVSNYGEPQSIKLGHWDSLLNAIGVDIGSRFVQTDFGFVCHNDVLACRKGWLRHLEDKISGRRRGAAFLRDNGRINAMHVSGYLYDAGLYTREVADWYPVRGGWDVGDHYTQFLRDSALTYHLCPCTHNDPELVPVNDPTVVWTRPIRADRCLDDEGNVLYMHMGRGSFKSIGGYSQPGKTTHEDWVEFGRWIVGQWA